MWFYVHWKHSVKWDSCKNMKIVWNEKLFRWIRNAPMCSAEVITLLVQLIRLSFISQMTSPVPWSHDNHSLSLRNRCIDSPLGTKNTKQPTDYIFLFYLCTWSWVQRPDPLLSSIAVVRGQTLGDYRKDTVENKKQTCYIPYDNLLRWTPSFALVL